MKELRRIARWAEGFECPNADAHGCDPCPTCGEVEHVFRDEPYCEDCGTPHAGWWGALRRLIRGQP